LSAEIAIIVRKARPDDLIAVAAVFLACWHESYSDFLPPDVIDMFDEHGARALWRPMLSVLPADAVVYVAEQAGRGVLGVIRIGRDPDEPTAGHIFSLYVRPDTQGLGVGTRLLAAADDRFRGSGLHVATLWVFAANATAIGFYSRHGWQPDNGERVEAEYGEPELRLRRRVRRGGGDLKGGVA
jgi:ribosomal protein S18 acetylase RimI-like enzyme